MSHFTGETVVWRGPWRVDVPLDFHFYINPEADERLMQPAMLCLASFMAKEFINEQEAAASIQDDDDESLPTY